MSHIILVAAFVLLVVAVVLAVVSERDVKIDMGGWDPNSEHYRRKLMEWERGE